MKPRLKCSCRIYFQYCSGTGNQSKSKYFSMKIKLRVKMSTESVEEKIASLFEKIQFKKNTNQKIFSRWKDNSLQPINSALLSQASDLFSSVHRNVPSISTAPTYQDQAKRNEDFLKSRRDLLAQLEEINQVLEKDGEEAAEVLLRKYSQTLSSAIKWLALILLFGVLLAFARAVMLSN